jgi:hypothetical protein
MCHCVRHIIYTHFHDHQEVQMVEELDTGATIEACHNGICAAACAIACLIGGVTLVAWGAAGGIIGAWA